jgi:hypothetical protein
MIAYGKKHRYPFQVSFHVHPFPMLAFTSQANRGGGPSGWLVAIQ